MRRSLPYLGLLTAIGLLVAACGKPVINDGSHAIASQTAGPPPVESAGPPTIEGTGPERPAPTGKSQPSARLPSLPIGGDGSTEKKSVPSCVEATWLGPQIPSGFSVAVADVWIDPKNLFTLGKSGCPKPACKQSGTSFSFNSEGNSCHVTVIAQVYQSNSVDSAKLLMSGQVKCPTGKQAACDEFAARVREKIQSITLRLPPKTS
ncbi:MAG TPA: hypothetical protein VFC19_52050 [Candidatus Limnocylindrales bacterium]|nr:hypothetical protein [Candidatus Limnocylindrales bacterium]